MQWSTGCDGPLLFKIALSHYTAQSGGLTVATPGHASGYWPSVSGYHSCPAHTPEVWVMSMDGSEIIEHSFHSGRQASTSLSYSHYFCKCIHFQPWDIITTVLDKKQMKCSSFKPHHQQSKLSPSSLVPVYPHPLAHGPSF